MTDQKHTNSILPLALLTAVGMLATDLYLPAVPTLPTTLGGTAEQAQYTLSAFLATLAIGQLIWGWTSDRFGEGITILVGTALLIVGGLGCALAPNVEFLIFARIIQGFGAGAAAVAVPSLIRKQSGEIESVQAIGAVASIESIVPAAGPVLGAGLIALSSWRTSFALLAGSTLLLLPFIFRLMKKHRSHARAVASGRYTSLFKNSGFMSFALSYAIMFAALILMVMTAPQIIVHWYQLDVYFFSIMQVAGVTAFILLVRRGGKLAEKNGIESVMRAGSLLLAAACLGLILIAWFEFKSFLALSILWCVFCCGLALRGPSTMTRALSLSSQMEGKASGLLTFFAFGLCSIATTVLAHYLGEGLLPVAVTMGAMIALSTALTMRQRRTFKHG